MKKSRLPILLLTTVALSGCGSAMLSRPALRDAQTEAQAAFADCNAQLRSGALKSYRQAAACARPKVLAAYQRNAYPFMDLVQLDLYAREQGAKNIDAGTASVAEVNRQLTVLERRIDAEQARRIAARNATTGAAPPVPLGNLLVSLNAINGTEAPRGSGSATAGGTPCFQLGNFTHCDTGPAMPVP